MSAPIIPTACEICGEDFDEVGSPHVEALEVTGLFVCDECADGVIEDNARLFDNGQFGVGA